MRRGHINYDACRIWLYSCGCIHFYDPYAWQLGNTHHCDRHAMDKQGRRRMWHEHVASSKKLERVRLDRSSFLKWMEAQKPTVAEREVEK